MKTKKRPQTVWHGCYDDSWKGFIVDEAFAHPAKMARALVGRIFDYLFERCYISRGEVVVDPFGGIGTTAIIGASRGLRVICNELEPKFVALAKRNFEIHRRVWESAGDPLPRIVCGDSRQLRSVLAGCDALVSSPPFQESISSGEAARKILIDNYKTRGTQNTSQEAINRLETRFAVDCGSTPGQLGSMPPGSVDAVLSSPPYAETCLKAGTETAADRVQRLIGEGKLKEAESVRQHNSGKANNIAQTGYGTTSGNLGNLPAGDVAAVVSSPPYWDAKVGGNDPEVERARVKRKIESGEINPLTAGKYSQHSQDVLAQYGDDPNNLGNRDQATFWEAARDIVAECFAILKPGGVAVWVVKGFVRNKKLVDFPHDWQRLCEACGFVLVEEIHASLVKESRNKDLFGGVKVDRTERKSFFRRLAEKKGSPKIDFETVLVMRKEADE